MSLSKDKGGKIKVTAETGEALKPEAALAAESPEALEPQAEKTPEAQEYYERLLRCAAEIENLKKRQEREKSELLQFANENLIKELLPVVDNLERALEHGRQLDAPAPMLEGLELVHQGFLKALTRFGVTPIESVGQQRGDAGRDHGRGGLHHPERITERLHPPEPAAQAGHGGGGPQ